MRLAAIRQDFGWWRLNLPPTAMSLPPDRRFVRYDCELSGARFYKHRGRLRLAKAIHRHRLGRFWKSIHGRRIGRTVCAFRAGSLRLPFFLFALVSLGVLLP